SCLPYYCLSLSRSLALRILHSFPTRRSSDLSIIAVVLTVVFLILAFNYRDLIDPGPLTRLEFLWMDQKFKMRGFEPPGNDVVMRSEEHTSELQSQSNLVCRLLLEKKKKLSSFSDPVTGGAFSVRFLVAVESSFFADPRSINGHDLIITPTVLLSCQFIINNFSVVT